MISPRTFTDAQIHKNRYLIAMTVTLAAMMELLDTSIVNVAIPQIMGNLGATLEEVTWVSTGYIVANVIVLPLSGWLSDFFGRRRYFMGSITLFIVASFFCGNAHTLESLVFWRIVQGVGGGGLISTAQSTIYEAFPAKELGSGMAIFGLGIMVGPTLGPTVGGYITYQSSWPWIFFINLPFGLVALLLANTFVPDSRFKRIVSDVDWVGIILLAIGIGTLQVMLERGEKQQWFESGEIQAYAAVTLTALSTFVWHELRRHNPVVDFSVLRDKQFAASLVFSFLLGMALFATVFYLPLYLQTLLNYNAFQTGMVILPGAIASGVTMAMLGRLTQKIDIDMRVLSIIGILVFGLSMYQHGQFTTQSGNHDFFWPLILRGIGLGALFVPLNALAMARIAPEKISNATGLYTLVRQLGGSVGIALAATLYTHMQATFTADIGLHVSQQAGATQTWLTRTQQMLVNHGSTLAEAQQKSWTLLQGQISGQAAMISFEHLFVFFSLALVLAMPLLLLMPTARNIGSQGGSAH
jgi:DHA2 family multidrug resistance protein